MRLGEHALSRYNNRPASGIAEGAGIEGPLAAFEVAEDVASEVAGDALSDSNSSDL